MDSNLEHYRHLLRMYMHSATGSIDTKEGWILSYTSDEIEERGLTAEECFKEDIEVTLFEI